MRFKTRLKTEKVPELLRIVQVLEKLEKRCVLHLSAPEVELVRIVVQADVLGSVAAYASFKRIEWFESYRIESQNANQIGLEMDMQNLLRALRSASAADHILIKLAKKGVPVLTFEIATPLGPILQDIPVVVLSAVRLAEYEQPDYHYVKGLALPSLMKLHSVVDRMKVLSNTLQLDVHLAHETGTFTARVNTDTASVSTTYRALSLASYDEDGASAPDGDLDESFEATVDLKHFSKSLYGHQLQPKHAICFIHQNCVMVHLIVPSEVGITYFIPRRIAT